MIKPTKPGADLEQAFANNESVSEVVKGMNNMAARTVNLADAARDQGFIDSVIKTWPDFNPENGMASHPPQGFPGDQRPLFLVDAMMNLREISVGIIEGQESPISRGPEYERNAFYGAAIASTIVAGQVTAGTHI